MWLLLVLLIILLFSEYALFEHDVLSPTLITTFMFFMSSFMLVFYMNRWGMVWNDKTTAVIFVGIIAMFVGELAGRKSRVSRRNISHTKLMIGPIAIGGNERFDDDAIKIDTSWLIICNIIGVVALFVYYRETIALASRYSGVESLVIAQINEIKGQGYSVSSLAQQLLTVSNSMALLFSYVFIYNLGKKKRFPLKFLYVTPVVLYFVTTLLTSSRAMFLHFMVTIFVMWLLVRQRKNGFSNRGNIKLFSKVLLLASVVIVAFYYAGTLTGKSMHYDSLSDNLANYFCSSIYAFNSFLTDSSKFTRTDFFGIHTFSGIYSTLRSFGCNIPSSIIALEYIPCGYVVTNIYTAFRRYFQDFGWFGMAFVLFCISFFYSKRIKYNRLESYSGIRTIVTAMVFYPLVFMSIEERFFMNVVSISTVYTIIYLVFFYYFLVYPSTRLKEVSSSR